MKIYYKNIFDYKKNWSHLRVEVKKQEKPLIQLHSGGLRRFRLVNGESPIFWGNITNHNDGVWVLKNDYHQDLPSLFVPPITSQLVEGSKSLSEINRMRFWINFFLKSLESRKENFLYDGIWQISVGLKMWNRPYHHNAPIWVVNQSDKHTGNKQLHYIDFDFNYQCLMPTKAMPKEEEGRVKWWRKKVKEGTCPPIFTWSVNCLNSYVILDGHRRLEAFLLEKQKPDVVVINSLKEWKPTFSKDIEYQEEIRKIKENTAKNIEAHKERMGIDRYNSILIELYDDRSYVDSITKSTAKRNFEEHWIKEVSQFKGIEGIDQEDLEAMIAGDFPKQPKSIK